MSNPGTAELTVNSITITGLNAGDFSQLNSCPIPPATVPVGTGPSASCTITVKFSPTATGTRVATMTISHSAASVPQTVALTGNGTAPAANLAPTALDFGDQLVGTTSPSKPVTLKNTGTGALTISSITITGTNIPSFTATTCGGVTTLAPGASCTISVTFNPKVPAELKSATLSIADSATGSPHTIPLSGRGTAPIVSLAPAALDFGNQNVSTTRGVKTATLTNTGTGPLTISAIGIAGAQAGDFAQTNTCGTLPATLPTGTGPTSSCIISVTFKPTATGTRIASVSITDSAFGSPRSIALTGNGTAPGETLSPTPLAFGDQLVGTTVTKPVTLTNTGTGPLTINTISIVGPDYTQTHTCGTLPATLGPGLTCTINVTFTPTATGLRPATLTTTDNAAGSPHTVSVNGNGTAPIVTPAPSPLAFGNQLVGTTVTNLLTLTNTGTGPLTINSISIVDPNIVANFSQINGDCPLSPATLAAGLKCTIKVTFKPTATGPSSATLIITDSASGSPHTVTLTGTGTTPVVSSVPTALAFGAQLINTSSTQTITITNSGSGPLSITGINLVSINFAQTNTCPTGTATLAPATSCAITVTFNPTTVGPKASTLTITDTAAGSPRNVALSGTGTAPAVTLSPAVLTFSPQLVNTTSPAQTVTLTNSGSAPLSIIGISLLSADFIVQTNLCPTGTATLAPSGICTITVAFTPKSTGAKVATLSISDNAAGTPHQVSLNGTGIAPAVSLLPSPLAFGPLLVGTTVTKSVTLTNSGSAPLIISGIVVAGPDFSLASHTCLLSPASLAPYPAAGSTCTINVTFTPTVSLTPVGGPYPRAGTITITANAGIHTLQLTGSGIAPAVTLFPSPLGFGSQKFSTLAPVTITKTVMLTNSGSAPLTISSISITGATIDFKINSLIITYCGPVLAPGLSCNIGVAFTPQALGPRAATLVLTDSASPGTHTVALTGTGI